MALAYRAQHLVTEPMYEGGCPHSECARDIYTLCRLATENRVLDMTPVEYEIWFKDTDVYHTYRPAFTMWRKACGMDVPSTEIEDAICEIGDCNDSIANPGVATALIAMGLVEEAKVYLAQYNKSPSADHPHVIQIVIMSHQEPPARPGKANRTGGAATKRTHRVSGPI